MAVFTQLPIVSLSTLSQISPPTPKIHTDEDVAAWQRTSGYQIYGLFLRRLNDSVVGHELPLEGYDLDSEVGNMAFGVRRAVN